MSDCLAGMYDLETQGHNSKNSALWSFTVYAMSDCLAGMYDLEMQGHYSKNRALWPFTVNIVLQPFNMDKMQISLKMLI